MKKFLVILNCFLGVLLFVLLISCLAKLTKKEQAYQPAPFRLHVV